MSLALGLGMLVQIMFQDCRANDASQHIIVAHAESLILVADEIKHEIKKHCRGLKGYGKLFGVDAQIRGRAAAVVRRLKRDPNYSNLDRDLEKLTLLTVELDAEYEALIVHARQVRNEQAVMNTRHVKTKIVKARKIANSMRVARGGGLLPLVTENPDVQVDSEHNPQVDSARSISPIFGNTSFQSESSRSTDRLRLTAPLPTTEPSRSTEALRTTKPADGSSKMHSVLEK